MSRLRFPLLLSILLPALLLPAQTAPAAHPDIHRRRELPHEREIVPPPSAYNGHPKLVVILVLDQFRGDYLNRWRADFKDDNGFNLFLDRGAWFPDCYYDYANNETAPGHAAIATGAYSNGNGIASNSWWDVARNQQRPVTSVEDERYELVGLPPTSIPGDRPGAPADAAKYVTGASPRNLLASTIGDELRLATQGQARVYGISLKDRAAILSAGAAANGAFWIDPTSGYFVTSSFYMSQLPPWAQAFDSGDNIAQAEQEAGLTNVTNFYSQVGATPAANDYEIQFAEALIQGEQLGQGNVTDMLTLSLSANDLVGHQYGPDSPQEEQMVDALDTQLSGFFTWLDKNIPGGLGNVWIALTADHGVAPVAATAAGYGLNAATIDLKKLVSELNYAMNMKFSPGEKIVYIEPRQSLPYISLNESQFMKDGIDEQEAEQAVQQALPAAFNLLAPMPPEPPPSTSPVAGSGPGSLQPSDTRLPPRPVLFRSYTRTQLAAGALPPTPWGRLIANSYSPNGGWYLMVIPAAYQMATTHGTTHFTPYSYDRHVPLGFWGAPFAPGTYLNRVQPVDIAPTLAALLGINQPSAAVGQVLTEALKPAADVVYPRPEVLRPHHEPLHPVRPAPAVKPETTAPGPAAKAPAASNTPAAKATPKPSAAQAPASHPPAAKPAAKPPAPTPSPKPSTPQSTGAVHP